jgi:hypothetical protein
MVSQDQGKSYFEVVGFSVSSPYSSQATVYSLKSPMMGVFDTTANTMQIDMSQLAVSIGGAGIVNKQDAYSVLRYDQSIFIIDMTMQYQGSSDYQTTFYITSILMIAPDGVQTAFTLQQPVQLIIDTMTYRISVPTFPQFADTFNSYYSNYASGYYTGVAPVIYQEPIYVTPTIYAPVYEPIPIFVAPVYVQPIPISGPYFIDTFAPSIYCNQFAIAAAAASAYAYGGDSFAAASAVASAVSGGGGYAFAAAQAAASAGIGGGGIAVASAAAAAAASGYDVASAASAVSTAVAGGGGASAAAAAAASAASGGADVGGIAAAAAAAGAVASNGDPILATNRIAERIDTPGAHHAFDTARQARQAGADPGTIPGRINEAVRSRGRQPGEVAGPGEAGAPGFDRGRDRIGAGAAPGRSQLDTGGGPGGQLRGHQGGFAAPSGPGATTAPGAGAGRFTTAPDRGTPGGPQGIRDVAGGQRTGIGTPRQAPISDFGSAISRGTQPAAGQGGQAGRGITQRMGPAAGQQIGQQAPGQQLSPASGAVGQRGPGGSQRIQAPQSTGSSPGRGFQAPSDRSFQPATRTGGQAPTSIRNVPSGAERQSTQRGFQAPASGGIKPVTQGGQKPSSVRSAPAARQPNVQSGGIKAPAGGARQSTQRGFQAPASGGIKPVTQGGQKPSSVRSAPAAKPDVRSRGFSAPSSGGSKAPSGGSFKAPSGGAGRSSSGGSQKPAVQQQSSGKRRR